MLFVKSPATVILPVPLIVPVLLPPLAVKAPVKVVAPVTFNVPPTLTLLLNVFAADQVFALPSKLVKESATASVVATVVVEPLIVPLEEITVSVPTAVKLLPFNVNFGVLTLVEPVTFGAEISPEKP